MHGRNTTNTHCWAALWGTTVDYLHSRYCPLNGGHSAGGGNLGNLIGINRRNRCCKILLLGRTITDNYQFLQTQNIRLKDNIDLGLVTYGNFLLLHPHI